MEFENRFRNGKARLLSDESICMENRELFREFFEFEERKLKRCNGLQMLDNGCYKTLYQYLILLRNVNRWFFNKPWAELTKDDIRRVYDGLEDGDILTQNGKPVLDRRGYYNKVFKSKPFRLAGKSELAKDVIEYSAPHRTEVRYATEEAVHLLAKAIAKPRYQLLLWLAWDTGENVGALLQLEPIDCIRSINRHTQRPEYLINFPDRKLKRSRQSRSEPTLYDETVQLLDAVLPQCEPGKPIFGFAHRQAQKFLVAAAKTTGTTTQPGNQPIRWKDLRSGMACHLLKMGWTRDEVNARLGHTPNSSALDAYINYLALDRVRPKEQLETATLEGVRHELRESRQQAKLLSERVRRQGEECDSLKGELLHARDEIVQIRSEVSRILRLLRNNASPETAMSVQGSCTAFASQLHGRTRNH